MTASMQLLQEQRAGIPGATAALTPVPMTRSSSWGCFRMRLFKNFLFKNKGRRKQQSTWKYCKIPVGKHL
jgi:hypothetical protein